MRIVRAIGPHPPINAGTDHINVGVRTSLVLLTQGFHIVLPPPVARNAPRVFFGCVRLANLHHLRITDGISERLVVVPSVT